MATEHAPANSADSDKFQLSPKAITAIVVAVLSLIFIFQNTSKGTIKFGWWNITAPAWLWLIVLFAAGVVFGSIFPWFRKKKPQTK